MQMEKTSLHRQQDLLQRSVDLQPSPLRLVVPALHVLWLRLSYLVHAVLRRPVQRVQSQLARSSSAHAMPHSQLPSAGNVPRKAVPVLCSLSKHGLGSWNFPSLASPCRNATGPA